MIRLTDACLLAYTKLRARKVRLIVTVVISSLLFSVLTLSSFVVRGMVKSANSFSEEGFGKRYILSADSFGGSPYEILSDPAVLNRAIQLQKDEIARKKAEAKRLGIDYDSTSERLVYYEGEGPTGKGKYLEMGHPLAQQAIQERLAEKPSPGLPELKKVSQNYQPVNFYESRYLSYGEQNAGELKVLKDGKEEFSQNQGHPGQFGGGLESFSSNWSLMSGDLLKVFTLDNSNGLATDPGVIPIVAPYSAVEQLLKLSPIPASAPANVRLARLQEVREKAAQLKFQVCHRNSTSTALVSQAINHRAEAEQNKNNKEYQKPSLMYDLPAGPCAPARISRDVRTADEKAIAAKQEKFRQTFGEEVPAQTMLNFVVIGVAPDPPGMATAFVDGLISSIVSSTLGSGWYTPIEYAEKVPVIDKQFPKHTMNGRPSTYYVELSSAESARNMIKNENCQPDFGSISVQTGPGPEMSNPYDACADKGKHFSFMPFGSSSLALDELQKGFGKVSRIAALVVVVLAGLIMMGTVGRIIADARRETAVFRAIGAKRTDIAQVYITYALAVSVLIIVVSVIIGFLLAQLAQTKFGSRFTVSALLAYNARDLSRQFYLYAWNSRDMLLVAGSALGAGLISTVFPLIRNLRRNPIKDMRDEN